MKRNRIFIATILLIVLVSIFTSCLNINDDSKDENPTIDFEEVQITDLEFLNWYAKEYDIDLVLMNKFEKFEDNAEKLKAGLASETVYKVSIEDPLFGEEYWKITNDGFDLDGIYAGELSDNKPDGFGILFDRYGFMRYMGEFEDGRFSGLGMSYYIPEDMGYDIWEYRSDEEMSKVIDRINYCKYIGEFKKGKFNGKGNYLSYPTIDAEEAYKEETGSPYAHITITVGEFENDLPDGKYRIYSKGYLYLDADLTGVGTGKADWYFPESKQIQYSGNLKEFKYHGKGTLYDQSGNVIYSGKWKNGDYE